MNWRIICPKCGSKELVYFREFVITKYYALDNHNEPTKRCIKKDGPEDCNMPSNWECKNCGLIFGGTAQEEPKYEDY